MPRVSVITPAHDSAATIGRTLESVLRQTFSDWEMVVADDASGDDTAAVVEAVADARVRLVRTPRNLGPAGARNVALGFATGEVVAFLDADDWWEPEYLERRLALLVPGVGIVAGDARVAVSDGSAFEPGTYFDLFGRRRVTEVTLERLLRRNTIFVSCLVPRAVGEEVGWFDEHLFGTEDHGLWIKILETGRRCVVDPSPLAVYRRTETSISRNTSRQGANNQKTMRTALERGKLTPRQQRIARSELRYNVALELVAAAAFDGRRPPLRALPMLAWVALTRPRHWGEWLTALRAG